MVKITDKRKKPFVLYDYEVAFNKSLEDIHEWFIEQMCKNRKTVIYALKEITSGNQLEAEIYPQFRSMDEVPEAGRIKKDNREAQKNLNDKNARKYVERLINQNFTHRTEFRQKSRERRAYHTKHELLVNIHH